MVFLDVEANDLLEELSNNNGLIHHHMSKQFDENFDISKIKNGDSVMVPFGKLDNFVKISKEFSLVPISASMKRYSMLPYRKCVAILLMKEGKVLACQRSDIPGAWQLPQGGVDENENHLETAKRELLEETNVRSIQLIGSTINLYRYDFPESSQRKFVENKKQVQYVGQELAFVVFKFLGSDDEINVDTEHGEFSSWKWVTIEELMQLIVDFKKQAYEKALKELEPAIKSTAA
jgi:putative (di)nucleoside polyphosphate hydrolase